MKLYPMIMAGGSGTRFWPRSRNHLPKQVLNIIDKEKTMIQSAMSLLDGLAENKNIHIVTNASQAPIIQNQTKLSSEQIIKEPCARDTAPCVGLSAAIALKKNPDAILLMIPSDHVILPKEKFHSAVKAAVHLAEEKNCIVTFGILPHFPATGYGYIEQGEKILTQYKDPAFEVKKFTEKPDQKTAIKFLETKKFFWNAGIFIWKAKTILDLIQEFMPDLYAGIEKMIAANFENIKEVYPTLPKISIDFGIMENAKGVKVIQVDYAWDDVGSWESLTNHFPKDSNGNLNQGKVVHLDSKNNITISDNPESLIATIGLHNLLIVQSGNSTLVADRARGQDIKKLVDLLKEKDLNEFL